MQPAFAKPYLSASSGSRDYCVRTYRVLAFDPGARSIHHIRCANDAEAMLQAINIGPAQMEVWEHARLVGNIRSFSDQPCPEVAPTGADLSAA
jgi:hypothetical protein